MKHKNKKHKENIVSHKVEYSILTSTILIIIATLFYEFQALGQKFQLRYAVTFFAIIILLDTFSLICDKQSKLQKYIYIVKSILIAFGIFVLFVMTYFIIQLLNV